MTVDAIKQAIASLPEETQVALAAWLNLQTMDAWDKEMQRDFSPGGRAYHVVNRARAQIHSGEFRPFSKGKPVENE